MSQNTKEPSAASPASTVQPAWSFPVALADVPDTGRRVDFSADERTRDEVAKVAGVIGLPRLEASFDLTKHGRDALRAVGRVVARVRQNCVVTLDPIESEVDEPIDVVFTEAGDAAEKPKGAAYQSVDANDPPEAMRGGVADLGAVATEFLLLGIDPYPRKEGVTFDAPVESDPSANPFAALAALKNENPKKR
jgi:uncharacterized protein DUF177 involved in 23S rRNA accumulation